MQIKIKSLFFGIFFSLSLLFNLLFIFLLIISGLSKTSSVSFFAPDNYISAAAVISVPKTQSASVDKMSVELKPHDKAYLQFSVFSGQKKQGYLIFTPLFDPNIVSILQTGGSMEITALKEGNTLIQTFTNEGIKDVVLVTVIE
jgi:hypothetical protein